MDFSKTPNQVKQAIFTLVAISLPVESVQINWSYELFTHLAKVLGLPENYAAGYALMVSTSHATHLEDMKDNDSAVVAYKQILLNNEINICDLYIYLLMLMVIVKQCDSRGRTALRTLSTLLGISPTDVVCIEHTFTNLLAVSQKELSHNFKKKDDRRSNMLRYAKIGAVGLGAGAALALTGGLAAPAIAGALLVMGAGSAVTALVSMGTMAALFGGTGAGLAGSKLYRPYYLVLSQESEISVVVG